MASRPDPLPSIYARAEPLLLVVSPLATTLVTVVAGAVAAAVAVVVDRRSVAACRAVDMVAPVALAAVAVVP